jgi:LysR family cys regulon transcriptional activator
VLELDNPADGKDFADESAGAFTIATTTRRRAALPQVVAAFRRRYPGVRLQLLQGNPTPSRRW